MKKMVMAGSNVQKNSSRVLPRNGGAVRVVAGLLAEAHDRVEQEPLDDHEDDGRKAQREAEELVDPSAFSSGGVAEQRVVYADDKPGDDSQYADDDGKEAARGVEDHRLATGRVRTGCMSHGAPSPRMSARRTMVSGKGELRA